MSCRPLSITLAGNGTQVGVFDACCAIDSDGLEDVPPSDDSVCSGEIDVKGGNFRARADLKARILGGQ